MLHLDVHDASRDRFLREIDALARLRHHGVVRVLAAGETDDRRLYLVMELVEGEDLLNRLQRGPMPWMESCEVFRMVADGMRHADRRGIHHRDLKPSNVMLTRDGGGVLVDFGIALDIDRTRLTGSGSIPGTITYMAPELLNVDALSVAPGPADTYSFGQVMYEALTGNRAFDAPVGAAQLVRLVREKHDLGPLDPGGDAPWSVRNLVIMCTDPVPEARPSMAHVVRLLDAALSPDEQELDAIDEATRIIDRKGLKDVANSWPFHKAVNLSEDEERTLVMRVVQHAEDRRRTAAEQELSDLINRPSDLPGSSLISDNAIMEDEEQVQAFEADDILAELRRDRKGKWRQRMVEVALGVVLGMVSMAVVMCISGMFWWMS
ncbi:MAG: protein kinase [Rhodobacterales bacterium]|nr:protein kinase [Rhodobacterales bacterium]